MIDKLNEALEAYDTATGEVTAPPPAWFVETMRSQGTRNITVETWNALCMNVRRLASNGVSLNTLLKTFAKTMSEINQNFTNVINDLSENIESNAGGIKNNTDAIADEATARENADNSIKTKFEWEISQLSGFIDELAEDRTVTKVLTDDDSKLGTGTSVVQVGAALKYGLVNYVSGDTKYIRTYVLYDLNNVKTYGGTKLERVGDTVVFPKGTQTGVYVPVVENLYGSFFVRAYGKNDAGDHWLKVAPMTSKKELTGTAKTLGSSVFCGDYTSQFQISKYNASAASVDDMPLYDIQIECDGAITSGVYVYPAYDAKVYEIPQAVRDKCKNGWEDTINLIDRVIKHSDGTRTDISDYIPENFCEIPLMSSSIIRFEDGNGNAYCRFKITYKERIHGNLTNTP